MTQINNVHYLLSLIVTKNLVDGQADTKHWWVRQTGRERAGKVDLGRLVLGVAAVCWA